MRFTKKEYKKVNSKPYKSFILGGDIGGTNSALGVFGIKNSFPEILISFSYKSMELESLDAAINEVLDYCKKNYDIGIKKACIGVAGVVSPDNNYAKITKLGWNLSSKEIHKKTGLSQIIFINDFEAAGYGINIIKKNQFVAIKKGSKISKSNKIVIGAGTGLGKSLLVFNENKKFYEPVASEAGHMDFPAQAEQELRIAAFIKKNKKIKQNISYEHVLSGQGLRNLYLFFRKSNKFAPTKYTKEINKSNCSPELISRYRKLDKTCRAVFEAFRNNYAKFARGMALDDLSFGGIYIGGGIAPKNRDIFDKKFVELFEQSHERAYILKQIPIYLILDYDLGLLGAGFAGAKLLK